MTKFYLPADGLKLLFKKSVLIIIVLLGLALKGMSQDITKYAFKATSGTFTTLSSPSYPTLSTGGTTDEGYFNALPIGFDFWYMGTRYTTVSASTNGWLTLGANITNATPLNNLTSGGTPRPVIAPLWADLNIVAASNVCYLKTGSSPNRVFTIQYFSAKWPKSTTNTISFQVKLYETSGKIEFIYGPQSGSLNNAATAASIGISALATGNLNYLAVKNPGSWVADAGWESTTYYSYPNSGQTFSFTPVVPTAPTLLAFSGGTASSVTLNWTDNSSNENGFVIYRSSDNGANYNFVSQTVANVSSSIQAGLIPGTTYYWKVFAVTEGTLSSTAASANQTTCTATAPSVTSTIYYLKNATNAVPLTASGTGLLWGSQEGTVGSAGGTTPLTSKPYIDASSNQKKTHFTTLADNVTVTTVDYYNPNNAGAIDHLVLSIFDSKGAIIATSSTNTTLAASGVIVRIPNTFNYKIIKAGNYSIGASSGTGIIGSDNPSFPILEPSGTINITGVSSASNRCFNNIQFTQSNSVAPTPSTATIGSKDYFVSQTVNDCVSPQAKITVVVGTTLPPTISYSATPFCKSLTNNQPVTQTGATGGVYSSTEGLTISTSTGTIIPATSKAGIYTVTYIVAGGTATALVTITALPSATLSYGIFPLSTSLAIPQLPAFTGTTDGIYSSPGLNINPGTGAVTPSANTAGIYNVTYTMAATGGCLAQTTTTTVKILAAGTWTGLAGTDWNTAGNWPYSGALPVTGIPTIATPNTLIPVGLLNYPVLDAGTQAVNNITISSGASLKVTGATLQIAGTIANSGALNVSAGTIELNGSSLQTIAASTFANGVDTSILNLIISNQVNITGKLNLTGTLSFGTSNNTLTTGGFIVLRSTADGTARLADITIGNGKAISGNTIKGKVTIERYIPAKRTWCLLSAPLSATGAPTINAAWQEGVTSGNPSPGYGLQIVGGTIDNGFDLGVNTSPSLKVFNTATNALTGLPATPGTNVAISSYPGYFLFVRGSRSTNLKQGTAAALSPTTLRMKGQLITGDTTATLSGSKFALVGNPYASPINFKSLKKNNIHNKLYIWDTKLAGSYGLGGYVTVSFDVNSQSYDVTTSVSKISEHIPSGSAFFVEINDNKTPASITFSETDKSMGESNKSFRPAYGNEKLRVNLFGVNADGSTSLSDGILTTYHDNNANAVDEQDAVKFYNTGENLCIGRDGNMLAIERRQTIDGSDTSFLNLSALKKQTYQLQITTEAMENSGLVAFLKDTYSATINNTPLNMGGLTTISFTVNAEAKSFAVNRFSIVFAKPAAVLPVTFTSVKAYQQQKNIAVEWNTENELNIKEYTVEISSTGANFTKAATLPAKTNNGGSAVYNWTDANVAGGMHYYRIKSTELGGVENYSSIVKVNMGKATGGMAVYPNPVTNGVIGLQLNNLDRGQYNMRLLAPNGQVLLTKTLQHAGGSAMQKIPISNSITKGMYTLEIMNPDNSSNSISVAVQ